MKNILILFVFLLLMQNQCFGDQKSRPLAINPHIRILAYSPDETHLYTGFYDYASSIVLENGETVETMAVGDPAGWKVDAKDNRIFIKPVDVDVDTNAILITNRRVYYIKLHAQEARGLNDNELVFETRFVYSDSSFESGCTTSASHLPDMTETSRLNFKYKVSGSDDIKPNRVFDDGKFTYLEFPHENVHMPAVFKVDSNGTEALTNVRTLRDSRSERKLLVVESIESLFTLRYGDEHVCVKSEDRPFIYKKTKKKRFSR